MRYLNHITMTTGHLMQQHRRDADADAIARVSAMLDSALIGGRPEVLDGTILKATHFGPHLLATLCLGVAPIITTGVAKRPRAARRFWGDLITTATVPVTVTADDMPAPPWIADRIEAGAMHRPDILQWTGSWAAVLGWAWMEYAR
ncbi:MAG: hypothetical protein Q4G24_10535 [Paracoccus sp. (in: a-proteobacteria)]|uniref:hypothetical protein n=1 Tax=Paracoccus sp. TaxID=267 RepID=UPI0026E083E1|nr:hypothetical protein [Paracoccus sp. (in: a-proteobacteria)]MDO5621894.1 hypothetical protein [Paracoccus sp. (in: a-proteobacteria)]